MDENKSIDPVDDGDTVVDGDEAAMKDVNPSFFYLLERKKGNVVFHLHTISPN